MDAAADNASDVCEPRHEDGIVGRCVGQRSTRNMHFTSQPSASERLAVAAARDDRGLCLRRQFGQTAAETEPGRLEHGLRSSELQRRAHGETMKGCGCLRGDFERTVGVGRGPTETRGRRAGEHAGGDSTRESRIPRGATAAPHVNASRPTRISNAARPGEPRRKARAMPARSSVETSAASRPFDS